MQKNETDEELHFKKRARRRLVGAVALVFLMVIILPMILEDREKSPPQGGVEIIMPSQKGSDLAALGGGISVRDKALSVDVAEEEPVKGQLVEFPTTETLETVTINPNPKVAEKKKVEKFSVKKAPKKPAKPVEIKNKTVENKPVTIAVVKNLNHATGKFYVQIGVFTEITNMGKLQSQLHDLGYQSVMEKVTTDKGVKTRLRTETFVGRNEAAIALENIKDSGLTGMVVSQK